MADTSSKESSVTKVPMIYVCGGMLYYLLFFIFSIALQEKYV